MSIDRSLASAENHLRSNLDNARFLKTGAHYNAGHRRLRFSFFITDARYLRMALSMPNGIRAGGPVAQLVRARA